MLAAPLAALLLSAAVPLEVPIANEAAITQGIVAQALQAIEKHRAGITRRDVHAKAHGCIKGTFTLDPGRSASTKAGLFAKDGSYPVWARLSNAGPTVKADSSPDARGVALKIIGVPGPKLLASDPAGNNLDLLFFTEPALPVKDAAEYAKVQKMIDGDKNPIVYSLQHPIVTGRLIKAGIDGALIKDPFAARYYSGAPYLFGASAVKYHLKPCSAVNIKPTSGAARLKDAMKAHLDTGRTCFALYAQLFVDAKKTPIEDFSAVWKESNAPLHPVARITFPKQSFDSPAQNEFCENLSMNPWRTLPEHRPLGNLNRVRRAIYEAIQQRRHADNRAPRVEPTGAEKF